MSRLSSLVPLNAGETLASNFSRIAAALDYPDAAALGTETKVSFPRLLFGDDDAVEAFADLLECHPKTLRSRTTPFSNRFSTYEINGHRLHKSLVDFKHPRFCPHCAVDDETAMEGRRGFRAFGRLTWLVTEITACPVHRTLLVPLADDHPTTHSLDFATRLHHVKARMPQELEAAVPSKLGAFQQYIAARLGIGERGKAWIDSLPLDVVMRLAGRLGHVERFGASGNGQRQEANFRFSADHGFALLSAGSDSFVDTVRKIARSGLRKTDLRGGMVFGPVYRLLNQQRANPDYDVVTRLFRDAALEEVPIARGNDFLGIVETQKVHSIYSAAKAHKIDQHLLARKLVQSGHLLPTALALPSHKVIVQAQAIDVLVRGVHEKVSASQARSMLNASRSHLNALVSTKLLTPTQGDRGGDQGDQRWFKRIGIEELLSRLDGLSNGAPGVTCTLEEAGRVASCSLDDVLVAVFDGSLRGIQTVSPGGLTGIRVDCAEFVRRINDFKLGYVSLKKAARLLEVASTTLDALIALGHIRVERARKPGQRKPATFIRQEEIDRFDRQFVCSRRYAYLAGFPMSDLPKRIGNAKPAFGPKGVGNLFYRREDLSI